MQDLRGCLLLGSQMMSKRYSSKVMAAVVFVAVAAISPAAAQIQITSTNPAAAPQGSTTLDVTISGSGFKRGAIAAWYVTGTTNPGGVTVNSTKFNGSSSLTANITIATNATLSSFDVLVTNTDGRTGKGTDMFTVTQKGTPLGCYTTGTPSGATLVTVLNPVDPNGSGALLYDVYGTTRLGDAIRVRPLNLNGHTVLAAFVTSGGGSGTIPGTYVFFLDPGTGLPLANNPANGSHWRNPLLLLKGYRNNQAAAGDVNGDSIPDFVQAGGLSTPYLFVGSVDNNYNPSWNAIAISPPASQSVAVGDVDGIGVDEIVFGGGSSSKTPGAVFIYKYVAGAANYVRQIQDPSSASGTGFGNAVVIGNIYGNGNGLVVGAPSGNTNGLVYVFPFPAQQSTYFTLTGSGPSFGRNLGIADVTLDGILDLTVISGKQGGTSAQALLYSGDVTASSPHDQLLPASANGGWGMPNIDVADTLLTGAVAVGAPNAVQGTSCSSIQGGQGAVHVFTSPFSASQSPRYVFETPSLVGSSQFEYGYGLSLVPRYPFIVIGEHFRDVGSTSMAGQVYVYKLN
jgi:hypothetical protein